MIEEDRVYIYTIQEYSAPHLKYLVSYYQVLLYMYYTVKPAIKEEPLGLGEALCVPHNASPKPNANIMTDPRQQAVHPRPVRMIRQCR
jgi:hypothetical protein